MRTRVPPIRRCKISGISTLCGGAPMRDFDPKEGLRNFVGKRRSNRLVYGAFHPPSGIAPIGARPMFVISHRVQTSYA